MKRRTVIIAAACLAAVGVVGFVALNRGGKLSKAVLPNPNGYDDFVTASQSMVPLSGEVTKLSAEELRDGVEQNSNALRVVRGGLARESAVPVVNDMNWFTTTHMPQMPLHKALAQLLVAEGMVHLHEGRTNEAARSFADCILFGHAVNRHGLLIDDLVGIACQGIGAKQLVPVLPNVSSNVLRNILRDMVALEASREPASRIIQRDRQWAAEAYGPLRTMWLRIVTPKAIRDAEAKFESKHLRSVATLRLVTAEVAVRLYQSEKGNPPATLAEVVPGLLPAVPLDPFSKSALVYRPSSNSFVLYSVGPDRKDDQGTPVGRANMEKGDLVPGSF